MIQNYKTVTLCGSSSFMEQFLETQKRLTLEDCTVISVGRSGLLQIALAPEGDCSKGLKND